MPPFVFGVGHGPLVRGLPVRWGLYSGQMRRIFYHVDWQFEAFCTKCVKTFMSNFLKLSYNVFVLSFWHVSVLNFMLPGAVGRSEACPLGMQAAPSSVPTSATFFHAKVSTSIHLLPLIQEEQLSVTGERMCAKYWLVGWLCWGLTSQSTIFQSCRDGAIASWVINQYFRGVKCLAQGHNTAAVGLEPRTSRSGVRHSTTEPPRSPLSTGKLPRRLAQEQCG